MSSYDEETPSQCYGCKSLSLQIVDLQDQLQSKATIKPISKNDIDRLWIEVGAKHGHTAFAMAIQNKMIEVND